MQSTRQAPNAIACFMADETGASPTEYVLLALLAAVVLGLAVLAMHQ